MATISIASVSITVCNDNCFNASIGGSCLKSQELWSSKHNSLNNLPRLTYQRKSNQPQIKKLSVRAKYNDRIGGEGDFVAGFLLGGALFGSAAYIFAPKIRKALRNEGENGFLRPKGPMYEGYYDDHEGGLEKTRHSLNEKIGQLNSAIDNVYSRLRGGKKMPPIPVESEADEFIA
ncbi:hypothetical protein RHMOL_Rhmol09G0275900 [Rhododendron molle]|uniref:Uncharacterized protein n=1 Tax=Rhododendron molle TaxID=49168 RepID=A0ACC0MHS4_RHOML|nr:hypothetical protein RHMOL_Rhmol09G0275900 [Rhododendron molle]